MIIFTKKQLLNMKIVLLFTGKTEEAYLNEGIGIYIRRLKRYIPVEIRIIGETGKKKASAGKHKIRESGKLSIPAGNLSYLALLDEKGDKFNSEEFAGFIEQIMTRGYKELVFVTGGAYGFPELMHRKADRKISLSDMTYTHQMVRLILAEQIYRAMTIIRGEPYHHS